MSLDELAANSFRISMTNQKLKNDNVKSENEANKTHFDVGKKIRQTIAELGGTMPEDLPLPDKSIKEIKNKQKYLN